MTMCDLHSTECIHFTAIKIDVCAVYCGSTANTKTVINIFSSSSFECERYGQRYAKTLSIYAHSDHYLFGTMRPHNKFMIIIEVQPAIECGHMIQTDRSIDRIRFHSVNEGASHRCRTKIPFIAGIRRYTHMPMHAFILRILSSFISMWPFSVVRRMNNKLQWISCSKTQCQTFQLPAKLTVSSVRRAQTQPSYLCTKNL